MYGHLFLESERVREASIGQRKTRRLLGVGTLLASCLTAGMAGAAGDLAVTPGAGLDGSGFTRGPFTVSSQVYTIENTSGATVVEWQVQKNQPWVSVSNTGGNLDPGGTVQVEVLINSLAFDLPVSTHTATITFWDITGFQSETRTVTLDLSLPGPGTAEAQSVPILDQYVITLTGALGTSYVLEDADNVAGPYSLFSSNVFNATTESVTLPADQGMQYFRAYSEGTGAVAPLLTFAQVEALDNSIVRVTGDEHGIYIIEGTTNTVDYIPVLTNKIPVGGEFTFTNTVFAPEAQVTYRAVPVGDAATPALHHILIVGESLALGLDGLPPLSTSPSPDNFRYRSTAQGKFFSPLSEVGLETIASGAAAHVVSQAPLHRIVTSNIGQGGAGYAQQMKGTPLYDLGLLQIMEAPQVLANNLFAYGPRAIFVAGGEADQLSPTFGPDMGQWQADYQGDIQYLTGFTGLIPMLHTQISGWSSISGGAFETVTGPSDLLAEHEANPTLTVLVGPRYFIPHGEAPQAQFPGIHPTNAGYRWLAEYYGKVYKQVVVDGGTWSPVRPLSINRSGNVITAVFNVPQPPLVFDTTTVVDPGHYGFEFASDDETPPTITDVSLVGADTVQITLSGAPSGGNERLRYAYTGIPGNNGGPITGPRGNLRDSDPTPSLYGNTLYNWCVHFDKPVLEQTLVSQSFTNSTAISIVDNANGNPYPATIQVAGLPTSITQVTLTLQRFTHTFPADVDVLLVSPSGQGLVVMSDVGGGIGVLNLLLTLSDAAAQSMTSSALVTGSYRPSDITSTPADAFGAPAPSGPYGTTLGAFNGLNPNGAWSLFIRDDGGGDSGTISQGWSLHIDAE